MTRNYMQMECTLSSAFLNESSNSQLQIQCWGFCIFLTCFEMQLLETAWCSAVPHTVRLQNGMLGREKKYFRMCLLQHCRGKSHCATARLSSVGGGVRSCRGGKKYTELSKQVFCHCAWFVWGFTATILQSKRQTPLINSEKNGLSLWSVFSRNTVPHQQVSPTNPGNSSRACFKSGVKSQNV